MWPSQGTPTRSPGASATPAPDRLDPADDLVTRDDRQLRIGQLAVDDVQVGAADAAGLDAQPDLPGAGIRIGPILEREPLAGPPQHHRAHAARLTRNGAGRNRFGGSPARRLRQAAFFRPIPRLIQLTPAKTRSTPRKIPSV